MAAMRKISRIRVENVGNGVVYWCELVLDGVKLRQTYGNTNQRTQEVRIFERTGRRFESPAAVEQEVAKFLETRGKSYATRQRTEDLVPAIEDALAPAATNPALEAEVLAARDDATAAGAASVYADWLQTQGDLRGELASLWIAGKADEASSWLADRAPRFFGELDVKLDSEISDLVWRHGFLGGVSLKRASGDSTTDLAAMTRTFLALPVARFLTALRFGLASHESDNDWTETMRAVAAAPQAAHLRSLRFDDYQSEDCEISWAPFGDFSPFWSAFPVLEELRLRSGAGGTLGVLDLPQLRTFVRESGGLDDDEIRAILEAKWPRLEHLEIWTGDNNYGAAATVEHFAALLDGHAPPKLVHLGLVNSELTHELIEPLARSPLVRRLRVLDLSKGVLKDGDSERLLRHADAFRHLERLDLSENQLDGSVAAIRTALPNAVLDEQRVDGDRDRYVAVGE